MLTGVNSLHTFAARALLPALLLATPPGGAPDPPGRTAAPQETSGVTGAGGTPSSSPSPRWEWPITGRPRVLRGFAPPAQPWLAGHRGIDLDARPGTGVRAAGAGTVGYAGPLAGRGVVTVLHPGGLRTTYLPVRPTVRRGQAVVAGEVIGVLQDAPGHCPVPCLHWGLLRDRMYLDPLLLLGHGQVRLLPLWPLRPPQPGG
ncbi:murein hydrolase activator EnvC family protein [Streptosporangium fragile]|uniref:murein hydrolase activator EnvC family protein n=1 Tax=Streptosporangium fragile TaxID=46186 RepID=UPI0031F16CD7